MATVILIPTSPNLQSKLRICEGFLRAYGHELKHLDCQLAAGQISQADYDECTRPIGSDIEHLTREVDRIRGLMPRSPEAPLEQLYTPAPDANNDHLISAKN